MTLRHLKKMLALPQPEGPLPQRNCAFEVHRSLISDASMNQVTKIMECCEGETYLYPSG
jgi:hypothetical protein